MPFKPLPASFLAIVDKLADGPHVVVELGCGTGEFAALPGLDRLHVVGVDRAQPAAPAAAVVGDALAPPLREGSCDLVIAANLARHLAPRRRRWDFLLNWAGLLKPRGSLFVFEDAPRPRGGPAGNYGRLQDFLARLAPDQRGPLVPRSGALRHLPGLGLVAAESGEGVNAWPLDTAAVTALLARGRPRPGGEAADLMAAIARKGISCGPYWWVRIVRGEAARP